MAESLKTYVGAMIASAAVCAAVARTTPHPLSRKPVTMDQAHEVYAESSEKEPGQRAHAAGEFRGFPWSQDDDFHHQESKLAKDYAKAHHVSVESVLVALDEGMRSGWPTPNGTVPNPKVMPCRPRLTY
jgi:hypothetical protein